MSEGASFVSLLLVSRHLSFLIMVSWCRNHGERIRSCPEICLSFSVARLHPGIPEPRSQKLALYHNVSLQRVLPRDKPASRLCWLKNCRGAQSVLRCTRRGSETAQDLFYILKQSKPEPEYASLNFFLALESTSL